MANKKISELQSRTPALSDLMLVGDPSSGYSYKCTVTALATIIETDIADGYVTIGTTQTISGAKTFSNNLTLTSVANATTTQTKFLTLNASNVVNYRTGAEVLADIGGQGTISLAAIGSTPNANGATLSSNTLTLQPASASFGGVLTTGFQEIAGWKRFTGNPIQFDNHLEIKNLNSWGVSWGYTSFASKDTPVFGFLRGHSSTGSVTYNAWFTYGTTGDRNYTLPSSDGTLALTSQVPTVSGTTNYVAKFTSSSAIGNSQIFDNGTSVGINTATPNEKLEVSGVVRVSRTTSASAYLNLTIENGVAGFDARGSIDQVFYTGALERMRIGFGGDVTISTIANATVDTDKFLVSDSGVIKYRTGAEVLSDIGGASSSSISGTTNYIPKFTSSSAIGNSVIQENSGSIGINGAATPNSGDTRLQVNGSTYSSLFTFSTNIQGIFRSHEPNSVLYIGTITNHSLSFLTNDTERMRLDASGNLGLGTSSPYTASNYIFATTNGTNGSGYVTRVNGTNSMLVYSNSSASTISEQRALPIVFETTGATRMTLDASGNLGLGVSPSAWYTGYTALQVGESASLFSNRTSADTRTTQLANNAYLNTGATNWIYAQTDEATRYGQVSGEHQWFTAPSGTAGNAISWTQAMTLDASGRLGIGTTSPSTRLDVNGVGTFQTGFQVVNGGAGLSYAASRLMGQMESANMFRMYVSGQDASTKGALEIYNATSTGSPTIGLAITASSNVGIGTTSPTQPLVIKKDQNASTIALIDNQNQNAAANSTLRLGAYGGEWDLAVPYSASNANPLIFEFSDSEKMRITSGGNVGIGTSSPSAKLHIGESGAAAQLWLQRTDGYNPVKLIGGTLADGSGFKITMNTTDAFAITSGALVGIGTTSPTYKLTVNGGIATTNDVTASTGSLGVLLGTASSALGSSDLGFIISDNGAYGTYNDLIISPRNNGAGNQGNFRVYTGGSERMRITSGGELLINTTSDAGDYKLQVNGNSYFNGNVIANTGVYGLFANSASRGGFYSYNNVIGTGTDYSPTVWSETGLYFTTNGATKALTLTSTQNAEFAGSIKTAAPSGGTAKPWKLGEAGVTLGGSNTSGVRVEIDGVVYYLVTGYLP